MLTMTRIRALPEHKRPSMTHLSVTPRLSNGTTALHLAAMDGYQEIVGMLLAAGADAGTETEGMDIPLHFAACEGHPRVVELLLPARPDLVNRRNCYGETSLMLAAQQGHIENVKGLLAAGGDAGLTAENGKSSLMMAACLEDQRIFKMLKTCISSQYITEVDNEENDQSSEGYF